MTFPTFDPTFPARAVKALAEQADREALELAADLLSTSTYGYTLHGIVNAHSAIASLSTSTTNKISMVSLTVSSLSTNLVSVASGLTTAVASLSSSTSTGLSTLSTGLATFARSLTSITVRLVQSKTTNTSLISSAEGLEDHAVAGTAVYLMVTGN